MSHTHTPIVSRVATPQVPQLKNVHLFGEYSRNTLGEGQLVQLCAAARDPFTLHIGTRGREAEHERLAALAARVQQAVRAMGGQARVVVEVRG